MSSDDEPPINDLDVSERETQFVPRSDDDETLWEVQEITAERGKKYKVKWSGLDPATGKPWAQSWVAKHDCTDKLVAEWKAKKRLDAGNKKRGRPSTKSRSSISSKSDRTSTTKKESRPSTSKVASSSRLASVEEDLSPPASKSSTKRKRQSETPAAEVGGSKLASPPRSSSVENFLSLPPRKPASKRKRQSVTPAETSASAGQADDRHDSESSRPRKKQKSMVEILLPPLESGEEDIPPGPAPQRHKSPPKGIRASLPEEDSPPPKGKPRAPFRKEALQEEGDAVSEASGFGDASGLLTSKRKIVHRLNTSNRVHLARESPSEPKGVAKLKRKVESVVSPPMKVGPPRGVKRQAKQRQSDSPSKSGPSRPKSPQNKPSDDECIVVEDAEDRFDGWAAPDNPMLDPIAPTSPPRLSIPQVPITRPHSPDLSPGARARLELFDRMVIGTDDVYQPVEVNAAFDDHGHYDPPLPPSPPPAPPPMSKPRVAKPGTPNGLVVPETESSGNSQTQSQPIPKPPSLQIPPSREPAPRKTVDLPTIAVISATTPSSTVSPDELLPPPQRYPSVAALKKSTFKPVPHISPNTFRSHLRTVDEAPPSSIESFASPKRADKGKQKAVEVDAVDSDLSDDGDKDHMRSRKRTEGRVTDSVLKRRGQELSNQEQQRREAERQKKKSAKRLKDVDSIINGSFSSSPMGSSLPFTGGDNALQLFVVAGERFDQSEAGNSTTLDTQGQSPRKSLTEEDKVRLRVELRQEEEESTQEALGYPMPPHAEVQNGDGDVEMSPPRRSKDSPFIRPVDDVDPVEQPSTDLQQASVLVQASQEQRHEDPDVEPLPTITTTSSPARPIPENLSDSPKRRLGEALSLLNVKSEEIQRLEHELDGARKAIQGLEGELAQTQRSPKPSETDVAAWELERHDWLKTRENLEAHVAVLVKKADKERVERVELEAERAAWIKEREEIVDKMTQQSEELAVLTRIRGEHDQDRLKWEAEKVLWAEEKANWELERAALLEKQETLSRSVDELTGNVESLMAGKASAETDRDFFREQYAQASGFVGSVREENVELEKRVKIAEGQAQEGVAGIKALFEGRVKALQLDIGRWKGLTELLQEKDRRTNDELRYRAAQAPELEYLCRQLTEENKSLEAHLRKLDQTQQRTITHRNRLYHEILMLKKERASLKSKISQAIKMAGSSTQGTSTLSQPQPALVVEEVEMDPNDMEILPDPMSQSSQVNQDEPSLFPCMWRPQLRDQCQQIFDTKEDLERHLREHFRDLVTR